MMGNLYWMLEVIMMCGDRSMSQWEDVRGQSSDWFIPVLCVWVGSSVSPCSS